MMQKSSSCKDNQNASNLFSNNDIKLHIKCRSTDPNDLKPYEVSREKKNDASKEKTSLEPVTV